MTSGEDQIYDLVKSIDMRLERLELLLKLNGVTHETPTPPERHLSVMESPETAQPQGVARTRAKSPAVGAPYSVEDITNIENPYEELANMVDQRKQSLNMVQFLQQKYHLDSLYYDVDWRETSKEDRKYVMSRIHEFFKSYPERKRKCVIQLILNSMDGHD